MRKLLIIIVAIATLTLMVIKVTHLKNEVTTVFKNNNAINIKNNNANFASENNANTTTRIKAHVRRVIDGDTIIIDEYVRVRLIGIDTPETVKEGTPIQKYGKEASDYTRSQIEGKDIYLEKDVSEADRYGRSLRYVFLEDGTFFNEVLVRQGYARVIKIKPDVKYYDVLKQAECEAKKEGKGIWQ